MGSGLEQNRMAQVTGSMISGVRDACRNGLLDWSPRLMLAMYTCDIQASSQYSSNCANSKTIDEAYLADVLGKVYGVVAKRRGRIVAEEMKEGTSFFNVSALLPVVESFGFADGASILKMSRGCGPTSHGCSQISGSAHQAPPARS